MTVERQFRQRYAEFLNRTGLEPTECIISLDLAARADQRAKKHSEMYRSWHPRIRFKLNTEAPPGTLYLRHVAQLVLALLFVAIAGGGCWHRVDPIDGPEPELHWVRGTACPPAWRFLYVDRVRQRDGTDRLYAVCDARKR